MCEGIDVDLVLGWLQDVIAGRNILAEGVAPRLEFIDPMKLIQVLCVVLTELSIGSLLMASLLPPREIRASFFTFISLLCALSAAIALICQSGSC